MLLSNAIYKLFKGNCPEQKSVVTCSGRNFMGGSCPGVVVQGELFREKCPGGKCPGTSCPGGISLSRGKCPDTDKKVLSHRPKE